VNLNVQHHKQQVGRAMRWLIGKDILIFIMFVGLVTLIWWGNSMSSIREGSVVVNVHYSGVEDRIMFSTSLPTRLDIAIRDKGKQIRQISRQKLSIDINLANQIVDSEGTVQITADMLRTRVQDALPGTTVLQINPEKITAEYHFQEEKKVPIRLISTVKCVDQHQLKGDAKLSTDSVFIYGSKHELANIQYILTDTLTISELRDSITQMVNLQIPTTIRCNTPSIKVQYKAEAYTEKSFTLPIQPQNVPQDKRLMLMPSEVDVYVRVGVSEYTQISEKDLTAICQYPTNQGDAIPVEIKTNNPIIKHIRYYPSSVEYIIKP
jgi:YbbR domain-containing protein